MRDYLVPRTHPTPQPARPAKTGFGIFFEQRAHLTVDIAAMIVEVTTQTAVFGVTHV